MQYQPKILNSETILDLEILREQIKKFLLISGRINCYISRLLLDVIVKRNLQEIIDNIFYYTSKFNLKFADRVNLILTKDITGKECLCGKKILKIKTYNGKCIGLNDYCNQSCANKYTNYKRSKEFYKEVSTKIVKTRKEKKNYIPSDNFKNYNKTESNRIKNKQIIKEKYGVENAGVLGAYSSKSAESFIRNYLNKHKIDENKCYFKNGGINNKEYFQVVYSKELKRNVYFSYDLVVFNDDLTEIILVLEYNGPWHYNLEEMQNNSNKPATPYKNSKTIKETYDFDLFKLNTIKKKCDKILIYWQKEKKIIEYDGIKL
jgi:hypothetical protein